MITIICSAVVSSVISLNQTRRLMISTKNVYCFDKSRKAAEQQKNEKFT